MRSRATHIHSGFGGGGFLGQSQSGMLGGPKGGFGFDRWRRLFGLGDLGAAVGTEELTDQTLLVALSVDGGNDFQADDWGAHRLAEHFLGPERETESERGVFALGSVDPCLPLHGGTGCLRREHTERLPVKSAGDERKEANELQLHVRSVPQGDDVTAGQNTNGR
ncbi:hypothetical protein EYF80_001130 [Liparis tanakae]|uniref:Uncharacterized protein n=1 Tax=Liparis tanakae TaxID=230148 RepID=A0A4Z2JGK6_9TELE|nr:hypothetical protein EYF80_001130 [Liparis tanakae]